MFPRRRSYIDWTRWFSYSYVESICLISIVVVIALLIRCDVPGRKEETSYLNVDVVVTTYEEPLKFYGVNDDVKLPTEPLEWLYRLKRRIDSLSSPSYRRRSRAFLRIYAMNATAAEATREGFRRAGFDPVEASVTLLQGDNGREEYGYFSHIVRRYETLADLTFFLQADTPDEVFRAPGVPRGSWHASDVAEKIENVTRSALTTPSSNGVRWMPLSDEPIGWVRRDAPRSDFRPSFVRLVRRSFGVDLGPEEFAWKNQIFVASRERILEYSISQYVKAIEYVQRDRRREIEFLLGGNDVFDEDGGVRVVPRRRGSPKVYPNAGDQFERAWSLLFGRCNGAWISCDTCPDDCGPCKIVVVETRKHVGGSFFGKTNIVCSDIN